MHTCLHGMRDMPTLNAGQACRHADMQTDIRTHKHHALIHPYQQQWQQQPAVKGYRLCSQAAAAPSALLLG